MSSVVLRVVFGFVFASVAIVVPDAVLVVYAEVDETDIEREVSESQDVNNEVFECNAGCGMLVHYKGRRGRECCCEKSLFACHCG